MMRLADYEFEIRKESDGNILIDVERDFWDYPTTIRLSQTDALSLAYTIIGEAISGE